MKERPILFSAPMVRALLAGTKTQTRRVVKPQPPEDCGPIDCGRYHPTIIDRHGDEQPGPEIFGAYDAWGQWGVRCPYGQPGDRLWVRETWGYIDPDCSGEDHDDEQEGPGQTVFCDELLQEGHPLRDFWRRRVAYRASWQDPKYGIGPDAPKRWRPSIHMPRWASRITLEITDVRVEKLGDLSESDARQEGVASRDEFIELWKSINGQWEPETWTWVLQFRKV